MLTWRRTRVTLLPWLTDPPAATNSLHRYTIAMAWRAADVAITPRRPANIGSLTTGAAPTCCSIIAADAALKSRSLSHIHDDGLRSEQRVASRSSFKSGNRTLTSAISD